MSERRAPAADRVHPRKQPGQWIAVLSVLLLFGSMAAAIVTSPNMHWAVVGQYLLDGAIIDGAIVTVSLTALTMVFGSVLGTVVALMRLSSFNSLRSCGWLYIWLFRSTPVLVALVFWYNVALFVPQISLSVPFGPELLRVDTNRVIGPFTAAVIAFSLNEAAYMAEIVRAGILSVPREQSDAGLSIGMSHRMIFRRVVLPQALRTILPPTGNEVVAVLKGTSLVFAISVGDLMTSAKVIYSGNYEVIALLVVVTMWYLALTSSLAVVQTVLERRLTPGGSEWSFWSSLRKNLFQGRPLQGKATG